MFVLTSSNLQISTRNLDSLLPNSEMTAEEVNANPTSTEVEDPLVEEPQQLQLPVTANADPSDQHSDLIQCLVCYSAIVTDPDQDHVKLPVDQLKDLVKVFQISVAPIKSDLPPKLFCNNCSGQIVQALELLGKIESLQNDFKVIKKSLKLNLMGKRVDQNDSEKNTIDQVRKTLVQGLSRSDFRLNPVVSIARLQTDQIASPLSPRSDEDVELEEMSDNPMGMLYPSIILEQDDSKGRSNSAQMSAKIEMEVGDKIDAEDIDRGDRDNKDATTTPKIGAGRPKRMVTLQLPTKIASASEPKHNRYCYDKERKLIAFTCPFCKRKIMREDYFTETGEYRFKCFPECCDKVLGNFRNLVVHHEATCDATPPNLYSKKRKARTTPKSVKKILKSEDNPVNSDLLLLLPKSGTRVYDCNNKLTSFTCPFCERVLLKEDYSTEEGTFVFKCFPDCCDKVTDNFNNLVAHHESFCPCKPQQLHSKKRRSTRKSDETSGAVKIEGFSEHSSTKRARKSRIDSKSKLEPERATVPKSAHRVYDGNNKLFSFGCPFCRKLIMRDDYCTGNGKYVFKCLPECCGKTADNFSNLVAHHESFCPAKPKQLHSKRRQSHKKPGLARGVGSTEKQVPMNQGFKYNAAHFVVGFKCPRCEKEFLPTDFQTNGGNWIFKCPFESCEKVTTTFVNLAYHHGVHCSRKTVKNTTSKKSPSETTNIVNTSSSVDKPFSCTRCSRKYKEQKALKFHMRLHYDDERILKCSVCGQSCEGRTKLNEHKRIHRTEYKSCSSCAKVFLNQQDLDSHVALEHNSTPENANDQEVTPHELILS